MPQMNINFKNYKIEVTATSPQGWDFQVSTVNQQEYAIAVTATSPGYWQSEIRDSQQRLVGCTCDRAPDSVFQRAIALIESFWIESVRSPLPVAVKV